MSASRRSRAPIHVNSVHRTGLERDAERIGERRIERGGITAKTKGRRRLFFFLCRRCPHSPFLVPLTADTERKKEEWTKRKEIWRLGQRQHDKLVFLVMTRRWKDGGVLNSGGCAAACKTKKRSKMVNDGRRADCHRESNESGNKTKRKRREEGETSPKKKLTETMVPPETKKVLRHAN